MKKTILWILSAVVGIVCSLVILMISGTIHMHVSAGIVAGGVAGILYYKFLAKSDSKLLISTVVAIVVYILYVLLYSAVNRNGDLDLFSLLVFFAPYIFASYVFFAVRSVKNSSVDPSNDVKNENNDNNDEEKQ